MNLSFVYATLISRCFNVEKARLLLRTWTEPRGHAGGEDKNVAHPAHSLASLLEVGFVRCRSRPPINPEVG